MKETEQASALSTRIATREITCGVVGLGYVGLPLAIELGRAGFTVIGFDTSPVVVETVNAGRSHVRDVESVEVQELAESGRFTATTQMARLAECDTISICVPTPLSKTKDPDVSYVVAAAKSVAAALRPGQLIVLESTTYPGSTRELVLPMLEADGLVVGKDFFLCFSPERVDPGNEEWTTRNTPKVIGGITPTCLEAGLELYTQVMERIVPVSSTEAAELTKLLENTFRAVNIALVNEMTQVSERLGVDIWEVIDAAATKPFGFMKFTPGPGIGGHCIPLDPYYLAWKMKTLDYKTRLVELASEVNAEMPAYVVKKIQDALNADQKALNGSKVLLLGMAYKRDSDDTRESPALDILRLLEGKGADVEFHDPHVEQIEDGTNVQQSIALTGAALRDADCVVITTDHSGIDYSWVVREAGLVVDTRNATRGIRSPKVVGLSSTGTRAHADSPPLAVAKG